METHTVWSTHRRQHGRILGWYFTLFFVLLLSFCFLDKGPGRPTVPLSPLRPQPETLEKCLSLSLRVSFSL
jgi:hypothetical protein